MAPIVPLMYVDNVVDGMLKGLDQQMFSFRCNLADSLLRVAAVALLLPLWGMAGYAAILFFSEIFNASLSIYRLLRVTEAGRRPRYLGGASGGGGRAAVLSALPVDGCALSGCREGPPYATISGRTCRKGDALCPIPEFCFSCF